MKSDTDLDQRSLSTQKLSRRAIIALLDNPDEQKELQKLYNQHDTLEELHEKLELYGDDIETLTNEECGAIEGISRQAISGIEHRGLQKLRTDSSIEEEDYR